MFPLADLTPESIGYLAGGLTVICALLAGIAKCVQIARRPTTHALCVYALALALAGLLAGAILSQLTHADLVSPGGKIAFAVFVPIAYVAALVMALIGLLDFRKNRATYLQGSKQAWWALGVSAVCLTIFGVSFYMAIKPMLDRDLANSANAGAAPSAAKTNSKPTVAAAHGATGDSKDNRSFEEFNINFQMPGPPWKDVNNKQFPPEIRLAITRADRDISCLLIPESLGVEASISNDTLVESVKNRATSAAHGTVHDQREASYNGLAGVRFEIDSSLRGHETHRAVWVVSNNGFCYQVHAVGPKSETAEVNRVLDEMCGRLHPIDADRVAHATGFEQATDFESPRFGYRVELGGTQWAHADAAPNSAVIAEYLAQYKDSAILAVFPFQLPDKTIDLDSLSTALMEVRGIAYPGPEIISTKPIEGSGKPGRLIEAVTSVSGTKRRELVHIIVADHQALMAVGCLLHDDPETRTIVEDVLTRVKEPSHPPDSSHSWSEPLRTATALVNNKLAIALQQKGDMAGSVDFLKTANEIRPEDEQILNNYVNALMLSDRPQEALKAITDSANSASQNSPLRALQAKLLIRNGDTTQARQILVKLFKSGYFSEAYLSSYVNLALDASAFDEALDVFNTVLEKQPTVLVRRLQATVYARKSDFEKAIPLLQKLHDDFPAELAVTTDLADVYEMKGDFAAALETNQKIAAAGHTDEGTLLACGRCQMGLHWYPQAKQTFEQALAANPNSKLIKDWLTQASSMLGEGDNSSLKQPIEPIVIPAALRTKIAEAKKSNGQLVTDGYDAAEILNVVGIDYHRGKPLKTTSWREVKVFSTGGVTSYGSLSLRFDPLNEHVFVNKLVVLDEAGKQVAEGATKDYYILDENSNNAAHTKKVLNLPVPGLKPGYTLRTEITTEELAPSDNFRFQEFVLSSTVPTGASAVFVSGDVAGITSHTTSFTHVERSPDLLYALEITPKPYAIEAMQARIDSFLPIIWLNEPAGSWEEIGAKYLERIQDRLAANDETSRLATELTKNCKTPSEKVRTLAAHVQNTCTYQAIEFGRRAQTPNPAVQTLRLKYGDCKDHAVLLRELLRSANIPAELALINTAGTLQNDMPSLDQFNHMVVCLPHLEGEGDAAARDDVLLDATNKDTFALLQPPVGLSNRDVLVLDPQKPRLVHTAPFPEDAAKLVCQRTIKLIAKDPVHGVFNTEVDEVVTLNLFMAPGLRNYLHGFPAAERADALRGYFDGGTQLQLKDYSIDHLDDVDQPLVVHLKYEVPEAFRVVSAAPEGATLVGHLPSPWEKTFIQAENTQRRKSPFEFFVPFRFESTTDFQLPKGFDLKDFDSQPQSEKTPFIAYATRVQPAEGALKVDYRARRFAGRHDPQEYVAYADATKRALSIFDRPMIIRATAASHGN